MVSATAEPGGPGLYQQIGCAVAVVDVDHPPSLEEPPDADVLDTEIDTS